MSTQSTSPVDLAIERIGATGAHRHRRYQLPWLMLVGEPGAGRTSLAAGARLRRPYGAPTRREMESEGWGVWLFDQGAVIDMPGMTEKPGPEFQGVIANLRRVRGQRPIDGVMLAVPATELTGPDALDEVGLDRKARELFTGLQTLRGELGVRCPIYVVITKCDVLPGFSAYCRTLPQHMRDEMLGWSSPHSANEPYSPGWVDEAFAHLDQGLSDTQQELFSAGRGDASEREAAFLFPTELRQMAGPVRRLLDGLFQSSPYTEPALFRGLYFCGDPDAEGLIQRGRSSNGEPRSPAFITHLLERKVFPESGLASPEAGAVRDNQRQVKWLQVAFGVSVVLGLMLFILLGFVFPGTRSVLRGADDQFLKPGQQLVSPNRRFALQYQGDGNLVVYDLTTKKARWSPHTNGKPAWRTVMQQDGNFVVYEAERKPVWAAMTQGHQGNELVLRNNGVLVVRGQDGKTLWASEQLESQNPN
jgi:type VI protein secretion system component VasK